MFLGKDDDGEYILDQNEPPFEAWELERAEGLLKLWDAAQWKPEQMVRPKCPHGSSPCQTRGECIEKIAWWRRYIREIERA